MKLIYASCFVWLCCINATALARNLAFIDLLAFDLKQTLEANGLTVKSVDISERDAPEPGLKRASLKVELVGESSKAMQAFEIVRGRSKHCGMQELRMKRPVASAKDFEISAKWVCFELVNS